MTDFLPSIIDQKAQALLQMLEEIMKLSIKIIDNDGIIIYEPPD